MKKQTICDYCNFMTFLVDSLMKNCAQSCSSADEFKDILSAVKAYYWIIIEFIAKYGDNICISCKYHNLLFLHEIKKCFYKTLSDNGQKLSADKKACDVCRYLPNIIFLLLFDTCKLEKKQDIEKMQDELQYHFFLIVLCEEMMSSCHKCENYTKYTTIVKTLSDYLINENLKQLDQFVRLWKNLNNFCSIMDCHRKLENLKRPKFSYVDLTGYTTYYFDFNVYDRYEKDQDFRNQLDTLSNRNDVRIIYSLSHLEEISRMNNETYQNKRLESLITLTKGYAAFGNASNRIAFCTCDFDEFYDYARHYCELNNFAEIEECNYSDYQDSFEMKKYTEKYSSDMGNYTLSEIVANAKATMSESVGYLPNLPSIEDMNFILNFVGVYSNTIDKYEDCVSKRDLTFHEIRTSILSLSRLMFIIGLHSDRIARKDNAEAGYPFYDKSSYRTIRSGYYDVDHLTIASKCTYFVTNDHKLIKRANDIYGFLGIKTKPISLKELSSFISSSDIV